MSDDIETAGKTIDLMVALKDSLRKQALRADAPALLDALHDVMVNAGSDPSQTSCGHEFMCICPQDAALTLLRKHGRLNTSEE